MFGNNRNPFRIAIELGLLGIIIAFLIFGSRLGNNRGDENTSAGVLSPAEVTGAVQVGKMAPDFTLDNLEGEEMALSDLRGRPVIINFWATWCAPCREEMPEFQDTIEAYADDNLELLAINREESREAIAEFFEELSAGEGINFTFPSLLDQQDRVAQAYGVFNMPTTFFINEDGVVTAVHFGQLSRSQIDRYLTDTLAPLTN